MSSIDNALTRIQEIATRIRQIQGLALGPPDLPAQLSGGPAAPAAGGAAAGATGTAGGTPGAAAGAGGASRSTASVNPAQFQKLLDALLAAQGGASSTGALSTGAGLSTGAAGLDALGGLGLGAGGVSGAGGTTDLASLGLPTDLASLLNTGAPSPAAAPGQASNATRLQSYQQELRNALRDLAAAQSRQAHGPLAR